MFNGLAWELCRFFWDMCSSKAFEYIDTDLEAFIYWDGKTREAQESWDKVELIIYPEGMDGLHSWDI